MTSKIRAVAINSNQILGGKVNCILPKDNSISMNFIVALLNSKLINFWYRERFNVQHMQGGALPINTTEIKNVPLPNMVTNKQIIDSIIGCVTEIEHNGNNLPKNMNQIDILIYKLYNLTYQQVLIIDPGFSLTQDDYDNYKID